MWRSAKALALGGLFFFSGSSTNAKTFGSETPEDPKNLTELPINVQTSYQRTPAEAICQAFEKNSEEVKQKFCKMMADTICRTTQENSDQRISKMTKMNASQKSVEIRQIFKEVTGNPAKLSYCLAGIMSNYMKATEDAGYSDLNNLLPESKTYCSTFMNDPFIKTCSQKVNNDVVSIEQYINMQDGKTFMLFLPRRGGSGFHATLIKKSEEGKVTLNAYNREHVGGALNGLVNYSRQQVGTVRAAIIVDMEKYVSMVLNNQLENCQTAEEFLAYATKGNTVEEVENMLESVDKKNKSGLTFEAIDIVPQEILQERIKADKQRIEEKARNWIDADMQEKLAEGTISIQQKPEHNRQHTKIRQRERIDS